MGACKRVLIVDDLQDWVVSLAGVLQHEGHAVRSAASGREAMQVAIEFKPEVAVLELDLPDICGIELGRQLRDHLGHDCRLIAVSCSTRCPESVKSASAGFAARLFKPTRIATMLAHIDR